MNLRFWRMPLAFDAAALQADLARLSDREWRSHFNADYHDGGWSGVALVSPDGSTQRIDPGPRDDRAGLATPLLERCPAIRAAIGSLPASVDTARLLRLAPGSSIREHADYDLGLAAGLVRLHVPIVSHADVEFYVDGVRVPMAEGECWYLDLSLPHRVQNHGPRERVHLVVDCRVDARLRALLPDAAEGERQVAALLAAAQATSQQRFEQFRERVLADPRLQESLRPHADVARFVDAVVRLGGDHGYAFTADDVRAALGAGRRAWRERDRF